MHANVLSWFRFHVSRQMRRRPFALPFGTVLLAACLVAGICLLSLARHGTTARRDIAIANHALGQPAAVSVSQSSGSVDLPRFEPNKLVETINQMATNTKLPLDEVSFVLEDNHTLPYLRYRFTLSVSARYPAIRHFIDALQADQPQVVLDAISCERDDIASTDTSCDVNLSAFYRRQDHG